MEHQRQIIDTFVNSVYVFDDRVVLNFNFTDDSKTISREEVLGSSAVENAPPQKSSDVCLRIFCLVDTGLEQGGPTGCGSQHLLRPLSGPCILLAAAPTAPPCFCRRQRSSPLQFPIIRNVYRDALSIK